MFYPTQSQFSGSDPFTFMRSMLSDLGGFASVAAAGAPYPAVNIWQGEEAVAVTAELPGVDPADLDISTKDNVLTISGERKAPELPEGARWHRSERPYGKFIRAIRLPFPASEKQVEARLTNGVLRVVIARPEEDRPRKIQIKAA